MIDVSGLTYVTLRFSLAPRGVAHLPPFLGSTLRGALGHGLRAVVGDEARDEGERALLGSTCPYLYVFGDPALDGAGRDACRPFVLTPPPRRERPWRRDERLAFEVTLFGRAQLHAAWLIAAVRRMAPRGLGADRAPFVLEEVADVADGSTLWREGDGVARQPLQREGAPGHPLGGSVTVRFATPLRARQQEIDTGPSFEQLVRWINRRLHPVLRDHCEEPPPTELGPIWAAARAVRTVSADLRRFDVERYSQRAGRRQRLRCHVGEVTFSGAPIADFAPLLHAGRVLHIGRTTTMGLGRYELLRSG